MIQYLTHELHINCLTFTLDPMLVVKAESHCRDYKNDIDHDAKRKHFYRLNECAYSAWSNSTKRMRSLCVEIVIAKAHYSTMKTNSGKKMWFFFLFICILCDIC